VVKVKEVKKEENTLISSSSSSEEEEETSEEDLAECIVLEEGKFKLNDIYMKKLA